MKITKEQMDQIRKLNEMIKDLDPILRERLVDYELYQMFKEEYLKIALHIRGNALHDQRSEESPLLRREQLQGSKSDRLPTLKEFFDEKRPTIATETVTVFGFYLEHYEKKSEFSEVDIGKAYFEARVRKPKVIAQALRDAKNVKGYLVEGSKKGSYRLSNIGENLVLHDLPSKTK
jgi:hypothetical protein